MRAGYAVRPADSRHELSTDVEVSEEPDGLKKRFR